MFQLNMIRERRKDCLNKCNILCQHNYDKCNFDKFLLRIQSLFTLGKLSTDGGKVLIFYLFTW